MFDIFRKNIVGDVITTRDYVKRYRYDGIIGTISSLIKEFNDSIGRRHSLFEMLLARHILDNSDLHHVDIYGQANQVNYKAIGSGKQIADKFCGTLIHSQISMKDFIKHAYLTISYIEQFCPGIGVGFGIGGVPTVKYMYYDKADDQEAPSEDINECKQFTTDKLAKLNETMDEVVKN